MNRTLYKWGIGLALLAWLAPSLLLQPGRAAAAASISLVMDGETLRPDVAPYIVPKANVTMVPIRIVSENLGATVGWSQGDRTATITGGGTVIRMTAGAAAAEVNGDGVPLDANVEVKNGRVMVPLRFVGENLGLTVDWNPSTRTVTLAGGLQAGIGNGSEAGGGSAGGSGGEAVAARTVVRGAWISSVYNLDWPSAASYGDAAKQQDEYRQKLDDLQAIGINTVYVQVRPAGDALYPSKLVPWSQFLTGTQGEDPGYDPLAYLIEETHSRGMRFEAWFNPFRASLGTTTNGLAANHVALLHPDWIVKAGSVSYINPGIPDARQSVIDDILEVVKGYDIDGVHLDDYFYPSGTTFDDDAAFRRYNASGFASKADWRRDNIDRFVEELSASIHAAKPQVEFGISPFGVWRNAKDDPSGSDTRASVTSYDSMYADVRKWIREGWIDYVVPQIYWSLSFASARYDVLTDWWANEVKGTNVKLYIGHAPYKLGTSEAGWQSAQEIVNELKYNSKVEQVQGDVFFSAKDLLANPLGLIPLLQSYYGA